MSHFLHVHKEQRASNKCVATHAQCGCSLHICTLSTNIKYHTQESHTKIEKESGRLWSTRLQMDKHVRTQMCALE